MSWSLISSPPPPVRDAISRSFTAASINRTVDTTRASLSFIPFFSRSAKRLRSISAPCQIVLRSGRGDKGYPKSTAGDHSCDAPDAGRVPGKGRCLNLIFDDPTFKGLACPFASVSS